MTTHQTGTREEWLAARLALLKVEKEHTHRGDELARRRQELPWVRIEKDYRFDTGHGNVSMADLFEGRSQLLIYHFMFGPDFTAGCPSCSSIADGFNGIAVHLANHDVMLWAVSRAPINQLLAYRQRMGWTFPWASSSDTSFNFDFNVSQTEQQQHDGSVEYNYAPSAPTAGKPAPPPTSPSARFGAACGTDARTYGRERPGVSAFALEDGDIYHTYSGYSRSVDGIWGMYQWLDRASKGRNEDGPWWRRHDEYSVR
jgi:predicted dithiol-disulfide oxidoreductase (DUF899 family)